MATLKNINFIKRSLITLKYFLEQVWQFETAMTAGKRFLCNRDGFIVLGRDGFIVLNRVGFIVLNRDGFINLHRYGRIVLGRDSYIVLGRDGFMVLGRNSLLLIVTINKGTSSLNVL